MGPGARAVRCVPALAWTGLIAWFSTGQFAAGATGPAVVGWLARLLPWADPDALALVHWSLRKVGHATEYAVLAALWAWALPGWRAPLALALATAFADELHQSTTLTREGSAADVLLDASGAALALALLRAGVAATVERAAIVLLWIAAAGGGLLLAIDLAAGAPPGWLWITTPVAWALLLARRYRARGPRPR